MGSKNNDVMIHKEKISEYLFRLFIINPNVVSIQQPNGKYITKYFSFNSDLIFKMLINDGSMGCYQQGYMNGLVRWICLDFDCTNKTNPDLHWLYNQAVKPCINYLENLKITYLTEFSGRRGIHVWIVFDDVLEKKQAFAIVQKILQQIDYPNDISDSFNIDCFPATASAYGNKVGKQVKIPLSFHRKGGRSFFFDVDFDLGIPSRKDFWENQNKLLSEYKTNNVNVCLDVLGLENLQENKGWKYYSYQVVEKVTCTAEHIIKILSETLVYKNIFDRLRCGIKENKDWFVLLGTLKYLKDSDKILNDIFSISPLYRQAMTKEKIIQWKGSYYPATFEYLYDIYQLPMESNIDASMTGFMYLLEKLGVSDKYIENNQVYRDSEKRSFQNAACIRRKEINYIKDNDEVITIAYWNRLKYLTGYDLDKIDQLVKEIKNGSLKKLDLQEFKVYVRKEKDKERKLVSLGAEDRIITTYLAMLVAYNLKNSWNSYSYNLMFWSEDDIFYNWYSSWENFIDSIKCYLEVPYLDDYGIIELDIKAFYDCIDYLAVYQMIEDKLSNENKNIMNCLIDYNDNLMRSINQGHRIGVPQGPAYARIIAEYFLFLVFDNLNNKCPELKKGDFKFSRYVDDMFLIYDKNIDGDILYDEMKSLLRKYGLQLNTNKSINYGRIKDIDDDVKKEILRFNRFHYEFKENDFNWSLNSSDKYNRFVKTVFAQTFSIDDITYVFGKMQSPFYQKLYFYKYASQIFCSENGRGSAFVRFYRFLFLNEDCLNSSLDKNLFSKIPINSINFKNCISQMYLIQQENLLDVMSCGMYEVLMEWQYKNVDEDERCIINALLENEKE